MKKIWNKKLTNALFLYSALYTIATIANSIIYLAQGIEKDPSGNWHELDRAIIVLIAVVAYSLIRYIHIKNFWIKIVVVYVPTMALTFLYVWLRGLQVELASTAYRDIFINYTIGFTIISVIVFIVQSIKKRTDKKSNLNSDLYE